MFQIMDMSKSIYNGIINSKSNNILTIDADLQNDPVDIPILYNVYKKNYSNCLVSGVRKKEWIVIKKKN